MILCRCFTISCIDTCGLIIVCVSYKQIYLYCSFHVSLNAHIVLHGVVPQLSLKCINIPYRVCNNIAKENGVSQTISARL